jgi:F-box/WD-40 domain protein 7
MVMSYLDARLLCAGAQCCCSWRNMANRDELWLKLCKKKGYDKLSSLRRPTWAEHSMPTSPHRHSLPSLSTTAHNTSGSTLPSMCWWWQVYIKAHTLNRNWAEGVYTVAPLLRGHRQRVTCIAHEDDQLVSGSSDGSVRVWNMDTLNCMHTLESHTADVNCIVAKVNIRPSGQA